MFMRNDGMSKSFKKLIPASISSDTITSISSNNCRAVGNLGGDLLTLSGDGLLTVLNGGDVNNSLADSSANLSWSGDWDLVTLLDWDRSTLWSRNSHWSRVSIVSSISISFSISSWLSISFSLSIASISSISSNSNSSMASNRHSWTNSSNSWSSSSNSVGGSCYTSGDNLAVTSNNSRTLVDLSRDLFTSSGDNLLTVLSDGGINNFIIFLVTFLSWGLNVSWVACLDWD